MLGLGTAGRRAKQPRWSVLLAIMGFVVGVVLTGSLAAFLYSPNHAFQMTNDNGAVSKLPSLQSNNGAVAAATRNPFVPLPSSDLGPSNTLMIMMPYSSVIAPQVEEKLRLLEKQGFTVMRRQGAALDNVCSVMATEALKAGWKEILWLDPHTDFDVGGVGLVRDSGKGLVGAVYPTADGKEFSTHFLPDSSEIEFGATGGVVEVEHTGMGFLYTKAEVFEQIESKLSLPTCNEGFEDELVPYFKSLVAERDGEPVYLLYHRAFCERALRAGLKVYVDTRIRANTLGLQSVSWEDVLNGGPRQPKATVGKVNVQALQAQIE